MFTPVERGLERGWPGRIEGDRVIQLAAQTLQSYFTGGGRAREHAEYPLGDVLLRAPVLHPPSVRLFETDGTFAFGNPASIVGPGAAISPPADAAELRYERRLAAVIGAAGVIGGVTQLVSWLAPGLTPAKDRDFATALGPVVLTADELDAGELPGLVARAARNTRLYPGDLIAAAPLDVRQAAEGPVEVETVGIGKLRLTVSSAHGGGVEAR
jgi:hypothetical protein